MYLKSFEGRNTNLFSPFRQVSVTTNAPLNVEVTLTVATQVDGAWCNVDVHQVVDNPALDMVNDMVDKVTPAHINDFYVG